MEFHPETPSADQLKAALAALDQDHAPRWGKLNAPRMVAHVNRFMQLYLGQLTMGGMTGFLARYLGKVFLHRVVRKSPFSTPKNLSTAPVLAVGPTAPCEWKDELRQFGILLDQIESLQGDYHHPVYGMMNAEDVKGLVRHHAAHHFNQFGLLSAKG